MINFHPFNVLIAFNEHKLTQQFWLIIVHRMMYMQETTPERD